MSDLDYATPEDRKAQEQDQRAADAERIERSHDAAFVMAAERGRAFIWTILEYAGLLHSSFTEGKADVTAFREGRRAVGLMILDRIEAEVPGALTVMRQEHLARLERHHVSPSKETTT